MFLVSLHSPFFIMDSQIHLTKPPTTSILIGLQMSVHHSQRVDTKRIEFIIINSKYERIEI